MQNGSTYGKISVSIILLFLSAGLLIGGLVSFYINFEEISKLDNEVQALKGQISQITIGSQNFTYQNITIYQNTTALTEIYANVRESVVLVQGTTNEGGVQGSGFAYEINNRNVVITNNHVVRGTSSLSVTFSNGKGYPATILGTDAYVDLAVVSVEAPKSEFKPIEIVSSSTLRVGDPVIAIGNPYGLVGSLTTGVVSAIGRTLTDEESIGLYSIANVIQTSAPINPGNSGGPLLNSLGKVIGVTTAIVSESQGLGFAIPSNAILREIAALTTTGTYRDHSYMGVSGQDVTYDLAQEMNLSVTYGWRIATVAAGGPSEDILNVNDVVIAMNDTLIRNNDDLATYLAEKTIPNQQIRLTVIRGDTVEDVTITLGRRPPPPT